MEPIKDKSKDSVATPKIVPMKVTSKKVTLRELSKGYVNNNEEGGVIGYGGKLDIRPPIQREFVYSPKEQAAVIDTIIKDLPLGTGYWNKEANGKFSIIDCQQRVISACNYIDGVFAFKNQYFFNLTKEEQKKILDYNRLYIYVCEGTEKQKLEWFKTINIASKTLTKQELRNSVYTGPWLSDAKKHFSKMRCPAYDIGRNYIKGTPIRQEYLETALSWISNNNIEDYMAKHQKDADANELWLDYQARIAWIKATFPVIRKEMREVTIWNQLYNEFKNKKIVAKDLEKEITTLMQDEEVTKKCGIYPYVLTRNGKYLSIRAFTNKIKAEAYENQGKKCSKCKKSFRLEEMEAHHIKRHTDGGRSTLNNCAMLCKNCHNITKAKG